MLLMPGSRARPSPYKMMAPRGTQLMFINAAAPLGWTRVTTFDDALLRIVGSAAPGSGGSNGFVATVNSQTQTGTGTSGGTSLSIANLAAHTHSAVNTNTAALGQTCGITAPFTAAGNTGSQGSGTAHTHTVPALSVSFSIKYVDALIARKN